MANDQLVLQINKINISPDKSYVKYNQNERGKVIDINVIDNDGINAYDLTNKKIRFVDEKEDNKLIIDDEADNPSHFTRANDTQGKFSYTFHDLVYQRSGIARFEIYTDSEHIDATANFEIQIENMTSTVVANESYISSLEGLVAHYRSAVNTTETETNQLIDSLNKQIAQAISDGNKSVADQVSSIKAIIQQMQTEYKSKSDALAKLTSDWQTQEKTINDAANKQLANLKTSNQADITAAVKSINDQRDAALKQLNDDKTKELADIQSDYNSWKTSTVKDFNDTVQPIKDSISENDQKLTTVSKQVSDAVTSMDSLKQQFDKVDFSKFVTGDTIKNYYTKEETDLRLQQAGKVKSVDNIQPDSNGNIQTDHYTKSQTDQKLGQKIAFVKCDSPQAAHDASMNPAADGSIVFGVYDMNDEPSQAVVGDQKINIEWLYNHLNDLSTQVSGLSNLQALINGKADSATVYTKTQVDQMIANAGKVKTVNNIQPDSNGNITIPAPDLSSKANQSDLNNTNNRVSAIEIGYMKKPTVISKADYDKLSTKDPNTLYEITE